MSTFYVYTYINKYIELKEPKYIQSGGYTQALSYAKKLAIRGLEDAQTIDSCA